MNPSGTSNRTFDGHIEPMRQPNLNLIDATQALHLGPNAASVIGGRLSADAHEFVPFATAPTASPSPYYPQQVYPAAAVNNTYQGQQQRFAGGQQQYQQHRQNIQQYSASGGGGGGGGGIPYGLQQQQQHHPAQQHHNHHPQSQQRLPSGVAAVANSVQSRLLTSNNNSNLDGTPNMYQGLPVAHHPQQQHHSNNNPYHSHHQQQQQQQQHHPHHHHNQHHHHNHQQQHHLVQQQGRRPNGHHMGPAAGAASATTAAAATNAGGAGAAGDDQTQEEISALEMLRETIQQLTDKPGMFEEFAMDLKEAFGDVIESRFVMSCAIEMLFEQSIMEPQCRYMGARLCQLLDTLATTSVGSANLFRELLILKLAHDETELPLCMQQEQLKVRGTTLFLSELYVQLNSDGEQRILELARSILSAMELLLAKPGPENAKCVCQALKLCGYQLEQDVGDGIEVVMGMLGKLEHELDTSSSRLIESVLKLRMSRWGRNNMAAKSSSSNYKPYAHSDGPVFYGPDGQVLTEDETSFLNAHSISSVSFMGGMPMGNMASGDASGYGGLDADDLNAEMDPMVQEAYRQFLRSNH